VGKVKTTIRGHVYDSNGKIRTLPRRFVKWAKMAYNTRVMSHEVANDKLVVIRIEGMHCAKCEKKIKQAVKVLPGIHEVEVDFLSRQASVLFDGNTSTVRELMEIIQGLGYHATGFTTQLGEETQPGHDVSNHPTSKAS
jgi:copper chaperone CopZ